MQNIKNEKFIFDNAVFSNFARIKRLELIFYLSNNIITTREVIEEVERGIKKKPDLAVIIEHVKSGGIKVVSIKQQPNILLAGRLLQDGVLGLGEISAMALAKELNGIFITDDKRATNRAAELGIRILSRVEFRDTVTFLKNLKYKKIILDDEYRRVKELLKEENFIF